MREEQDHERCSVQRKGYLGSPSSTSESTSPFMHLMAYQRLSTRAGCELGPEVFPNRPLFGIGFSLGANIMTNYVGEEGANCPLKACHIGWESF